MANLEIELKNGNPSIAEIKDREFDINYQSN